MLEAAAGESSLRAAPRAPRRRARRPVWPRCAGPRSWPPRSLSPMRPGRELLLELRPAPLQHARWLWQPRSCLRSRFLLVLRSRRAPAFAASLRLAPASVPAAPAAPPPARHARVRRAHAGTPASRRRSCAGAGPRAPTVRVPTASSRARSWVTSSNAPLNALRASSSASRDSRSRWLVGSSRISTFAPPLTRIASDRRRRSPPERPRERLVGVLAAEQEAPEQRARLAWRQPRLRAVQPAPRCPSSPSSSACWLTVADRDVVTTTQLPLGRAPACR